MTIKEDIEKVEGAVWHEYEELIVEGKRLGRHFHFDPREDASNLPMAPKVVSVMHKTYGLPLDQGSIGSCTANALVGALNSVPNLAASVEQRICSTVYGTGTPRPEADAVHLYEVETKMEGQPYPPNDPGGSGLMVARAAESLGWIKSYAHTYSPQHALMALTLRPVIMGVSWFDSFDTPDSNGLISISPNAAVRGGHEILAAGLSVPERLVFFVNSWGTSYGVANAALGVAGGAFAMSFDTFESLLASENYGDVTVPLV